MSEGDYTWVLCDDDKLYLNDVDDLIKILVDGKVDLIHVGAHEEIKWNYAGKKMSPKNLINGGYHYFKAGSFLPCNILKTENFQKYFIIKGYNSIWNAYPQMPFLANVYKENELVYLTKFRLVTAITGNQSYDFERWFFWWLNTSRTMDSWSGVRTFFFDHFFDAPLNKEYLFNSMQKFYLKNKTYKYTIGGFVGEFFTWKEKMLFYKGVVKKWLNK